MSNKWKIIKLALPDAFLSALLYENDSTVSMWGNIVQFYIVNKMYFFFHIQLLFVYKIRKTSQTMVGKKKEENT